MKNENDNAEAAALAYRRLYETIRTLRAPGGCPWDREQTPFTMREDLVEECFEATDAISQNDAAHAKEELGDVMLNASMISYMYEQRGDFSVADALNNLTDKLIRRHPHVFANSAGKSQMTGALKTGEEVLAQWDKIKENVEGRKSERSILDEVSKGLPPLLYAYKLQKKAAKKGFDWKTARTIVDKIHEELAEAEDAAAEFEKAKSVANNASAVGATADNASAVGETLAAGAAMSNAGAVDTLEKARANLEAECGDLLFAVVNYMRHLGVNPELALSAANKKFYRRFSYIERQCHERNIPMDAAHLDDEDTLWNEAKEKGL